MKIKEMNTKSTANKCVCSWLVLFFTKCLPACQYRTKQRLSASGHLRMPYLVTSNYQFIHSMAFSITICINVRPEFTVFSQHSTNTKCLFSASKSKSMDDKSYLLYGTFDRKNSLFICTFDQRHYFVFGTCITHGYHFCFI